MSVVHIFNPSHDEALAANTPYYTPAKAAAVLEYDLAALPAWWACQDDIVLVPKGHALDGQRINGCVLTSAPDWGKINHVCPWGNCSAPRPSGRTAGFAANRFAVGCNTEIIKPGNVGCHIGKHGCGNRAMYRKELVGHFQR